MRSLLIGWFVWAVVLRVIPASAGEACPPDALPQVFRTARSAADEPSGCPARVSALAGFVEAATFFPDERVVRAGSIVQ